MEQVLAHQLRRGVDKSHRVLQLIAEAERAARLVEPGPRPHPAPQRLVHEPAVGQYVECAVRRFDPHRAERVPPVLLHRCQCFLRRGRSAPALHDLTGRLDTGSGAEAETDLACLPNAQLDRDPDRSARIERGTDGAAEPRLRHRRRIAQGAVAAEELGAIAAPAPARDIVGHEKGDAPGKVRVVGVAREQRTAGRIELGAHMQTGFRGLVAKHPLQVAGDGKPARAARPIAHGQHRELDRRILCHVDDEFGFDAVLIVLENAVAEAVTRHIRRSTSPGQQRGRPVIAVVLIADVVRLGVRIADRVVRPRREPEFVGVLAPGRSAAGL